MQADLVPATSGHRQGYRCSRQLVLAAVERIVEKMISTVHKEQAVW